MVKFSGFILLFLFFINCNSQKSSAPSIMDIPENYFLGTWYFTQKNYEDAQKIKTFPLHKCMKQYTLTFTENKASTFLVKEYATGEDCSVKSSSGQLKVQIDGGSFSYFEADLRISDQFKIYSKNKFSIVYRDIINGKVTAIEDVYERKN